MAHRISTHLSSDVGTASALLHSALHGFGHSSHHHDEAPPPRAFVTISRQPGAGAIPLADQLVKTLNESPPGDWCAWDKDLVARVSAEHGIDRELVHALQEHAQSWFEQFLDGISTSTHPEELKIYRRIAATVRALATAGHCVLVGRGAQFVTSDLPNGIHLRLVASLKHRISAVARVFNITKEAAEKRIANDEHDRKIFYHRYWPNMELTPESFTLTLNMAMLPLDTAIQSIIPIIQSVEAGKREPALVS